MAPKTTVLIPTWNNVTCLGHALNSLLEHTRYDRTKPWFDVIVINNGSQESGDEIARILNNHKMVTVLHAGENLGWEAGLKLGLEHTQAPYVCFLNDDVHIVPGNSRWLQMMCEPLDRDATVAAVGPMSNFVMGQQNFYSALEPRMYTSSLLIGFCMLVRRTMLDKIGGVAQGLPGGDDFDLSIKMLERHYKLIIRGDVFVYHWGAVTGNRVRADCVPQSQKAVF